jgi:aryl-alcohol dehydrogenase-like predicted oxidoreductase
MGVFDVFQIPYSALNREHEQIITSASEAGAGIVIRGGAAHGGAREGRRSSDNWDAWKAAGLDDLLESGETPVEFILRFTMTHPAMDTNIVGTLSPEHLHSNVQAVAKGPLPEHVYEEARLRLVAAGVSPKPAAARS